MPKEPKSVGVQKYIPTKNEVKEVNDRLHDVVVATSKFDKIIFPVEKDTISSEVSTSNVRKQTKIVPPSGKEINLTENIITFPIV